MRSFPKIRRQIETTTTKFFVVFVLFFVFGFSTGFAQTRQTYVPVQRDRVVSEQRVASADAGSTANPLPFRNDASGRHLRAILDTVELILRPVGGSSMMFNPSLRPIIDERRVKWQQAFDTIGTLARLINTDNLARAYYFYGQGMIYRDQAWSGLLGRDSSIVVAQQAIRHFESYIQIGLGNPATVYESLAMMYFDFLRNSARALEYLDRSISLNPRHVYAYVSKAQILRNIGRLLEACQVLRQAREIEPLQMIEMMMRGLECQ